MKFTSGLVLKIVLAIAPAIIGSVVTYWLSKDKASDGYTTLSKSVNELQGAVEQLRLQAEHLQDLHFTNQPASAPANVCVAAETTASPKVAPTVNDWFKFLGTTKSAYTAKAEKMPSTKRFKRVPLKLDDAKK